MQPSDAVPWDLFLRGVVAGVLLLHLVHLAAPGARPAARLALAGFVASVLAYLFCQRAELLLTLPRPLAWCLVAGCVGSTAWLWAAARALFNDDFRFTAPVVAAIAGLVGLGLAANLPYFPPGHGPYLVHPPGSLVARLGQAHALAMLGFTGAALWEVGRGWQADLVVARRAARRWAALGIGAYAALALVVELALRGQAVGALLPALHVAGIGLLALAVAAWIARHDLAGLLGVEPVQPSTAADASAPSPPATPALRVGVPSPALRRLDSAMREQHLYRQEGLSLAGLAQTLGLGEAPLRELINGQLGFRNFNDYLHHHRLQEAAERLAREDLPILSIALECGYGSIGPFNRAFRQRFGMTPTEYRAAARMERHRQAT